MGFVYAIRSSQSSKIYVGMTILSLEARFTQHKRAARKGYESHLANAIRLYGETTFSIEGVYESDDIDILYQKERELIKKYDSIASGWNMTEGGKGGWRKGWTMSPEHKAKIIAALKGKKGKPISDSTKEKLSKSGRGKLRSDSTKRKISEGKMGHPVSLETRKKISDANKGRQHPKCVCRTCGKEIMIARAIRHIQAHEQATRRKGVA